MPAGPSNRCQFLFVDDDAGFLKSLTTLIKENYQAWTFLTASNQVQAEKHLKVQHVDLVVLTVETQLMNAVDFLRQLKRTHPGQRVVMLSGCLDETACKTAI